MRDVLQTPTEHRGIVENVRGANSQASVNDQKTYSTRKMEKRQATSIMERTKDVYDAIAESYAETTRPAVWNHVRAYTKYVQPSMNVLDIGCGDGRLAHHLRDHHITYTGVDISERFLEIARQHHGTLGSFQLMQENALPFPRETFDHAFAIAVIHHLPNTDTRREWIKEVFRVLKPGGYFTLTSWIGIASDMRFQLLANNIKHLLSPSTVGKNDLWLPWKKNQNPPKMRYYHIFSKHELLRLLRRGGFRILETTFTKNGERKFNILIHAQKPTELGTLPLVERRQQSPYGENLRVVTAPQQTTIQATNRR